MKRIHHVCCKYAVALDAFFFAISGVLPKDEAIKAIKDSILKTYSKKGEKIVQMNYDAVDHTLEHLKEIEVPNHVTSTFNKPDTVSAKAPRLAAEAGSDGQTSPTPATRGQPPWRPPGPAPESPRAESAAASTLKTTVSHMYHGYGSVYEIWVFLRKIKFLSKSREFSGLEIEISVKFD